MVIQAIVVYSIATSRIELRTWTRRAKELKKPAPRDFSDYVMKRAQLSEGTRDWRSESIMRKTAVNTKVYKMLGFAAPTAVHYLNVLNNKTDTGLTCNSTVKFR